MGGGGGRVFRQDKISGGKFRFSDCCLNFLPNFLRNTGHFLLLSLATFFFCREVLVPVYCMSGSVCMPLCIRTIFSCVSCESRRMILCTQCVSQGFVVPATVHKAPKLGGAKICPTRNFLQPIPPLYHLLPSHCHPVTIRSRAVRILHPVSSAPRHPCPRDHARC